MPSSSTEERENPAEHKTECRAHTSECLANNRKYLLWTQRYVYVLGWNFFFFPVLQNALHNRKKVFLDPIKINITRPINLQISYSPVNAKKSIIFSHLFPAKGQGPPFPSSSLHAQNRQISFQVPCLLSLFSLHCRTDWPWARCVLTNMNCCMDTDLIHYHILKTRFTLESGFHAGIWLTDFILY